jgi:hypothetical protein
VDSPNIFEVFGESTIADSLKNSEESTIVDSPNIFEVLGESAIVDSRNTLNTLENPQLWIRLIFF